ncbi:hypothetical protein [Neisseria sp. Ec49-e6-T10]|uniref:hypothetical protein n=1 Tax=Neisseria sp. Ec49-e6-T10 TaxID=3140744 RepID=UPI003EBDA5F7
MRISASSGVIMEAINNHDASTDQVSKVLMVIRELPMKLVSLFRKKEEKEPFGFHSFLFLGQKNNEEIAYGLVGKFWQFNFGLVPLSTPTEFQDFAGAGVAKLVMNFSIKEIEKNLCVLSTETRVFCPDKRTLILFSPYWYLIRLASGFIRKRMLLQIKREAE